MRMPRRSGGEHDDYSAAVVVSSPATPNGQGGELLDPCDRCGTGWSCIADQRCRKAPSPASPAETGANSKLRQVAPNLGVTSSAASPAETREGREAAGLLAAVSAWIDAGQGDRDPEAVLWGRVAKITEEAGEAIAALIGATGQNPRKGWTHTFEDVQSELLDVALTALAAVEHLNENNGSSLGLLTDKIVSVARRAGVRAASPAAVPLPEETGWPRVGERIEIPPGLVGTVLERQVMTEDERGHMTCHRLEEVRPLAPSLPAEQPGGQGT